MTISGAYGVKNHTFGTAFLAPDFVEGKDIRNAKLLTYEPFFICISHRKSYDIDF